MKHKILLEKYEGEIACREDLIMLIEDAQIQEDSEIISIIDNLKSKKGVSDKERWLLNEVILKLMNRKKEHERVTR